MGTKAPVPVKKKSRKKQESYIFLLMGFILLGLLISGYFLFVEKFLQPAASGSKTGTSGELAGNSEEHGTTAGPTAANLFLSGEGQEIVLFFGKKGTGLLEKEVRKIPEEKEFLKLARNLVDSLIQGPFGTGYSVIPPGTKLRSLFFHQGSFIADFSPELTENHPGGALEECLTVFSIVNTLTELDGKARVKILVNGNEADSLKGHVSLRQNFSRNEELISK